MKEPFDITKHPIKSDGGSTSYYEIPEGAVELNDLIEYKNMNFALGNIFKACYRLGQKEGTDAIYDLKKIIFFANRLIGMEEKKKKQIAKDPQLQQKILNDYKVASDSRTSLSRQLHSTLSIRDNEELEVAVKSLI